MNRFSWLLLVVGLWTAGNAPLQAGDPKLGNKGATTPSQPSLPVRVGVVIRNLWEIVWNKPPTRPVTGQTRLGWQWLATRYDQDGNGVVTREEFPPLLDIFERLDRTWDDRLTQDDFDWSGKGALGQQKATTFALFKSIDQSSDGWITSDEWQEAFSRAAQDKGYLNDQELEEFIFRPLVQKTLRERQMFAERAQAPSKRLERLIESGKLFTDGPELGEYAPDFTLGSADGKTRVRLSSYRGQKPVVLIFGSFT